MVYALSLKLPPRLDVAATCFEDLLYSLYTAFHPIGFSKHKRNTYYLGLAPVNHVGFTACHAPCVVHGGGSRIRTHVSFQRSGFQDRRLKPLGHPSAISLKRDTENLELRTLEPLTIFSFRSVQPRPYRISGLPESGRCRRPVDNFQGSPPVSFQQPIPTR